MKTVCILCGNDDNSPSEFYCRSCMSEHPQIIDRLNKDQDLMFILYAISKYGQPVPRQLFSRYLVSDQMVAKMVTDRMTPMLNFFTQALNLEILTVPHVGVLWCDICADVVSLYRNQDKKTDLAKVAIYNSRMLPLLHQWWGANLRAIGVLEFRKLKDQGFDVLQSKRVQS